MSPPELIVRTSGVNGDVNNDVKGMFEHQDVEFGALCQCYDAQTCTISLI